MEPRTSHYEEDILLGHLLETLDPEQDTAVEQHLKHCSQCSASLAAIEADLVALKGLNIPVYAPSIPYPGRVSGELKMLLRAAALIVLGFGLGTMSQLLNKSRNITLYSVAASHPTLSLQVDNPSTCISDNLDLFSD